MIPEPEGGIRTADPVDGRSTRVLLGSDEPENIAALHWRLSIPLMVPIVAVIAMCLSRTDHRRGRYVKMVPAFLIYLAYLMLLANARTVMETGDGGIKGNMWLIHALFLAAALAMLYLPGLWRAFKYRRYLREQA